MAETQAQLLADLALGCRILAHEGQGDLIWGHVSLRVPGAPNTFWLKGAALGLEEITPTEIITLDMDGNQLEGTANKHVEWPIHAGVLQARPDLNCVVHTHAMHAVAFAATGEPLRAVGHDGVRFSPPDVPRFTQTTSLIITPELGAAVAAALGDRSAVFLRSHGVVVAGESPQVAIALAVFLDRACELQLMAMSATGGRDYAYTPDDEALEKRKTLLSTGSYRPLWEYYRRKLG